MFRASLPKVANAHALAGRAPRMRGEANEIVLGIKGLSLPSGPYLARKTAAHEEKQPLGKHLVEFDPNKAFPRIKDICTSRDVAEKQVINPKGLPPQRKNEEKITSD
ncbi:hypothetical protein B0T10DRAFT_465587 [Thelonectria olida]|uniref:Uncharacterized protein n=1 Tax=Thelonectria olida TaxID=1576542 RepID=A0A9P9AFX9_9HYPO|nr:hypothetical protein B0T10DRAFT_465587 [Thelonectria olida]